MIGTGYTSASTIGRNPATLAEMRTRISTVKGLLAGQTVDFDGTPGRLGYPSGRRIPVIMAASGPKAIELAGEIADGVLLLVGFNRGIIERALERLAARSARAGGSTTSRSSGQYGPALQPRRRRLAVTPGRPPFTGVCCAGAATGWNLRVFDSPSSRYRRPCTDLSGSVPRARLGSCDRRHCLRSRRRRRSAVRRDRIDRDAGRLRQPHPRDGQARCTQSLPHAIGDVRSAGRGDRGVP